MARYIERSSEQGFVKPRDFIKNLLARIQWTRRLVLFVILCQEVRYVGGSLYQD